MIDTTLRNRLRKTLGIDVDYVIAGDANGNLADSVQPGNVLVRFVSGNGLFVAGSVRKPNNQITLNPGDPVELEYKHGKLRVAGTDIDGMIARGSNPVVTEIVKYNQQDLSVLAVTQTLPTATATVGVKAWNPYVSGVVYEFPGGSIDLTSVIPTSGNKAYIVIFVKSDYLTLEAKTSTPRLISDVDLDLADVNEAVALRTAGSTPVWAIALSNAQSAITQPEIAAGKDLRNTVNTEAGSIASPLTTKGDLWTYSTVNARLGIGADNTVLVADSTAATGNKWATLTSPSILTAVVIDPATTARNTITPTGSGIVPLTTNIPSGSVSLIQQWQSNTTNVASLSALGHAAFGQSTAPSATVIADGTKSFADPAAQVAGFRASITTTYTATNVQNVIGTLGVIAIDQSGSGASGINGGIQVAVRGIASATGSTRIITRLTGGQFIAQNTGAGGLASGIGLQVQAAINSGGGAFTSNAGLVIEAQTVATNNSYLVLGTSAIPTGNWGIYSTSSNASVLTGSLGIGAVTVPTARLHLAAGTTAASTAPLKFTSGALMTAAEAGANEFLTDKAYLTITTGAARKEYTLNDAALTAGVMPIATTNGRLTNLVAGTSTANPKPIGTIFDHYVDASVGGAEADIYTDTLPANIFGANGDKVIAQYGGIFVTLGTETVQLKVYLAGTAIWDSTGVVPALGTASWRVYVELIRVSSTVVRYTVSLNTTGASGFVYATVGELTGLTLSGTNILKITGQSSGAGSGAGDVIGKMSYEMWAAAA